MTRPRRVFHRLTCEVVEPVPHVFPTTRHLTAAGAARRLEDVLAAAQNVARRSGSTFEVRATFHPRTAP